MHRLNKFMMIILFVVFSFQSALAAIPPKLGEQQLHFKTIYFPEVIDIKVPTLVKVFIPEKQDYPLVILDQYSGQYQPIRRVMAVKENKVKLKVTNASSSIGLDKLLDNDFNTSVDFDLDQDGGTAFIVIEGSRPFTSHSLNLLTDRFVAVPYEIAISVEVDGAYKTVVARTKNINRTIDFLETTAQKWKIEMWHSQQLRLNEIELVDEGSKLENVGEEIVWLAQPNGMYVIFSDAQSYENIKTGESGNLYPQSDEIIRKLSLSEPIVNEFFEEPDFDDDGVIDLVDNCGNIANPNQEDLDENSLGDACEDHDRDGIINSKDNCPYNPNMGQEDEDGDEVGDLCDNKENRITERLPWLPWTAMGIAALLIIGMIIHTIKAERK